MGPILWALRRFKPGQATATGYGKENEDGNSSTSGPIQSHYMVNRRWHLRFWEQFRALSYKNMMVSWRNLRATLMRILAPLFFMFLLWLINIAIRSDNPNLDYFVENTDPTVFGAGPIPSCSADMYATSPCWDFLYAPNNNSAVEAVVTGIRENNPGRPIPPSSVIGFADEAAISDWLAVHSEQTLGAYLFSPNGSTGLNFLLQVNSTVRLFRGLFQDPTFFSQVPLQVAAEREISRYFWQQAGRDPATFSWTLDLSQFAHPTTDSINIVGQAVGPFVFAANLFGFVLLLSSVVMEREHGLRQALKNMGMLDSAFWLSWGFTELLAGVLFSLIIIAFGAAFQFAFFLRNSFGLLFLLFFVFQWAMTSTAFLFSTFISKSASAVYFGFVVFIVGWICQVVIAFDFPYSPDNVHSVPALTVIFALLPWSLLAKASTDLGLASSSSGPQGISWANRSDYCQNIQDPDAQSAAYVPGVYQDFDCVLSINQILIFLTLEAVVYFVLAVWLDNVLPNEHGVRKRPWFFLQPSYWNRSTSSSIHTPKPRRSLWPWRRSATVQTSEPSVVLAEPDADVAAEEQRMRDLLQHRTDDGPGLAANAAPIAAVEVFGLKRVFRPGFLSRLGHRLNRFFCCWLPLLRRKKGEAPQPLSQRLVPFWAIKGSWFSIEQDKLFCLLGPNGAGKTTTINCLTGVLPPTGGEVLVYGERLGSPGGADHIRSIMGVCQQFDVLWKELTGGDHMFIYGMVKGLSKQQLREQTAELMESVKLQQAVHVRTGAYSGGMRRRLSVAIALLGDPLIVYLDEPTTGMDPISRRHVWDVIEASKPGRAIVLTTHSMEEADILGDTVGIMARGSLRALGTPLRLKQRFGAGYQLSVSVLAPRRPGEGGEEAVEAMAERAAGVKQYFEQALGLAPVEENRAYMHFLVPKDRAAELPAVLGTLQARRAELGITDVQISLTSLEEVFLTIARRAEMEAAEAEGRSKVEVVLDDGTVAHVPMGDEFLQSAAGQRYAVKWAQDEAGNLQVLRCVPVAEQGGSQHSSTDGVAGDADAPTQPPPTQPGLTHRLSGKAQAAVLI